VGVGVGLGLGLGLDPRSRAPSWHRVRVRVGGSVGVRVRVRGWGWGRVRARVSLPLARLLGMCDVGDIVQHDAAVRVDGVVHVLPRAERGDDEGHLVLDAHLEVGHETLVAPVHDLVDRERCRRPVGVCGTVLGEIGLDLGEPLVEQLLGPRVERREGADDARLAR
jgi:hypothetical protein